MVTRVVGVLTGALICISSLATAQVDTPAAGEHVSQRSFNASTTHKVNVDFSIATIRIISDSPSAITATVTRKCTGVPSSGDVSWLNGNGLILAQNGDTVQARDHPSGEDSHVENTDSHRKQDVLLHVPVGIELQLNVGMGTVKVDGPIRSFDGNVGMGTASLVDAGVTGSPVASKFNLGAGKITAKWSKVIFGSVDLNTGMGALYVTLSKQQKATVDASSGMGHVDIKFPDAVLDRADETISAHETAKLNGGGVSFKLSSGLGQVTLGASN